MNAAQQAQQAYGRGNIPFRTDRNIEYDAFAKITHALKLADGSKNEDYAGFVTALHRNRNLWSIIAVDVADPDNKLSPDLKAQLFYLAEFTEQETRKLLRADGSAAGLVAVNVAVMRGLEGNGGSQ